MPHFLLLNATFLSAFAGVLLLLFLPSRWGGAAKWIAMLAALAGFGFAIAAFAVFDPAAAANGQPFQLRADLPWVPSLGMMFAVGADGISLSLLLLTGLVAVTGVLFSWNVTQQPRAFFGLFLLIIGGVYGVFQSLDLFLFFVFYELVIVPKYFLIANWGSTNREYGAMKLTLYSVAGSALIFLGLLAVYVLSPGAETAQGAALHTFHLLELARHPFSAGFQFWVFPVLFIGFGVLAGLWPFHTWAPTGHVAAPTAVSMLLAGVVMKLGAYGILRVAMTLCPLAVESWRMPCAALAVAGVLYGAWAALAQRDLKFVVGYSSINHMGLVLLGLLTLNTVGLSGAVLQMISHGIIGGLLFAIVGRMIYERTHTRQLDELGRLPLAKAMPFVAVAFVLASAASMGIPGFSGFMAEISILIGAWTAFPWLLLAAAIGCVLTAAFTLRALQQSFFPALFGKEASLGGEPPPDGSAHKAAHSESSHAEIHHADFTPITLPERLGTVLLIAATIGLGVASQWLLSPIRASFENPSSLMHALVKTAAEAAREAAQKGGL